MQKKVFAYVRVSTQKQGREGVSLQAQRDAVLRYATIHELQVVEWFEEQESAAKQGHPIFDRMVSQLKRGKATGFICHKLDRTVRNIYDWSTLSKLVDSGVQIHFAHESLDLESLSGKLSADIQAAIASHYSRNLRDEVRKGLVGRLKQGIYPFAAPVGYVNNGGGKAKTIDPVTGPLVRKAFELYSTGEYGFHALRQELFRLGLRSSTGKVLVPDRLTHILNNPFYYGLIRIRRTGETYAGVHDPLVTKRLFDRCHDVLHKKTRRRSLKHDHAFRKRLACSACGLNLIGETQKGHVYYRCHSGRCKGVSVREDKVANLIRCELEAFKPLLQSSDELKTRLSQRACNESVAIREHTKTLNLEAAGVAARLEKLLDLLVDGSIDNASYEKKRSGLITKQLEIGQRLRDLESTGIAYPDEAQMYLELMKSLETQIESAKPAQLIKMATPIASNFSVAHKTPCVTWISPFRELSQLAKNTTGAHDQDQRRTFERVAELLGLGEHPAPNP